MAMAQYLQNVTIWRALGYEGISDFNYFYYYLFKVMFSVLLKKKKVISWVI